MLPKSAQAGLLLLLALGACFIPLLSRGVPLLENEGVYFSVDQEVAQGARLYTDIWDHKPPLLFFQAHLTRPLRSSNPENARYYLALIHFINALLVGALAVRFLSKREYFWCAAFAYIAFALPPVFLTWTFEADLLMLPWLLSALLAATYGSLWSWTLAGFLWSGAFFTKQTALFYLPLFWVLAKRDRLTVAPAFVAGADVLALAVLWPFIQSHRVADFWEAVSGYNGTYIRGGWSYQMADGAPKFRYLTVPKLILPSLVSYGVLLCYGLGRLLNPDKNRTLDATQRNARVYLWVWTACAALACGASGLFLNYYFMAFLPVAALWVAPGLQGAQGKGLQKLAVIAASAASATAVLAFLVLGPLGVASKVYPLDRSLAARTLGQALKSQAEAHPSARLFPWASDPQVFVYSGLRVYEPRSLLLHHLYSDPDRMERLRSKFLQDPAEIVIVAQCPNFPPPPDWLTKALETRFQEDKNLEKSGAFKVYARRSS